MEQSLHWPWSVPFGELAFRLDALGVVFLVAVGVLSVCSGLYALGYMYPDRGRPAVRVHALFYLLFILVLGVIVTANNVILFLGAWETMTVVTYFLIIFHDEDLSVRKAGFIYLIASHCATFCLILMFFLMAHHAGGMNFDQIAQAHFPSALAGGIFLLALAGFGVKAGFIPLHIWLPHAHPAAPAHVSALLSGVAIKMGIYGICRVIWMLGDLPGWCGYAMLAIGVVSGVMGVLYALGQHELKKLLAYHSIENIGIIALGLGLGLLGQSERIPLLAALGFGGALLHVLNHSLFKGLLFLGAGAVIQRTHTGEMDRLGGLSRSMPVTSVLFLIGALSICGLPLFNGFVSEFIIYFGLFQGLFRLPLQGVIVCVLAIISLALMGALALACFSKVYGTVFSGIPRSEDGPMPAAKGESTSGWMLVPMGGLAWLCIWIGLAPETAVHLTFLAASSVLGLDPAGVDKAQILVPLSAVIALVFLFLALILGLILLRRMFAGPLPAEIQETWRCGFSQISSRGQYTSSSFARSIIDFVKNALLFQRRGARVAGAFPGRVRLESSVHDAAEEKVFFPVLATLLHLSRKIDDSRRRYTQVYLMYILLFLVFLLVWKLK